MRVSKQTILFSFNEASELLNNYKCLGILVIDKGNWYRVIKNIEYKDILFYLLGTTDKYKITDVRWYERGKRFRSIDVEGQHPLKAYKI